MVVGDATNISREKLQPEPRIEPWTSWHKKSAAYSSQGSHTGKLGFCN